MKLFLARHAHSVEGERFDPSLNLTSKGEQDCKMIRKFLKAGGFSFDVLFSSNYNRAVQTIQGIFGKKPDEPWYQLPELQPGGTPEDAFRRIYELYPYDDDTRMFVVTHNPLIQQMVATVAPFYSFDFNAFAHASVIRVTTHRIPPDKHPLHWQIRPSLIERFIENNVIESAVKVAESLDQRAKAKIVDPLIDRLRGSLARRFREQAKAYKKTGKLDRSEYPVLWSTFVATTDRAYDGGVNHVATQLAVLREAHLPLTVKKQIPGYGRNPDELERDIDSTTADRIKAIRQSAAENNLADATMMSLIAAKFREWATTRAQAIATNEISMAFHAGGADVASIVNEEGGGSFVQKKWVTDADPCEVCEENAQDGWIDEDILFASGDSEPPQHPSCKCGLDYRTKGGE